MRENIMKLVNLIQASKKEDWDFVDKNIPNVLKDIRIIEWAKNSGIDDSDGNVRYLAVSIIEKSPEEIKEIEDKLYYLMQTDSNIYVRYRSAFALVAHKSKKDIRIISSVLNEATKDEEVTDIAKEYLQSLNK